MDGSSTCPKDAPSCSRLLELPQHLLVNIYMHAGNSAAAAACCCAALRHAWALSLCDPARAVDILLHRHVSFDAAARQLYAYGEKSQFRSFVRLRYGAPMASAALACIAGMLASTDLLPGLHNSVPPGKSQSSTRADAEDQYALAVVRNLAARDVSSSITREAWKAVGRGAGLAGHEQVILFLLSRGVHPAEPLIGATMGLNVRLCNALLAAYKPVTTVELAEHTGAPWRQQVAAWGAGVGGAGGEGPGPAGPGTESLAASEQEVNKLCAEDFSIVLDIICMTAPCSPYMRGGVCGAGQGGPDGGGALGTRTCSSGSSGGGGGSGSSEGVQDEDGASSGRSGSAMLADAASCGGSSGSSGASSSSSSSGGGGGGGGGGGWEACKRDDHNAPSLSAMLSAAAAARAAAWTAAPAAISAAGPAATAQEAACVAATSAAAAALEAQSAQGHTAAASSGAADAADGTCPVGAPHAASPAAHEWAAADAAAAPPSPPWPSQAPQLGARCSGDGSSCGTSLASAGATPPLHGLPLSGRAMPPPATANHLKLARLLMRAWGADPRANGSMALWSAVWAGAGTMVLELMRAGADLEGVMNFHDVRERAAVQGRSDQVKAMLDSDGSVPAMDRAWLAWHVSVLPEMLALQQEEAVEQQGGAVRQVRLLGRVWKRVRNWFVRRYWELLLALIWSCIK